MYKFCLLIFGILMLHFGFASGQSNTSIHVSVNDTLMETMNVYVEDDLYENRKLFIANRADGLFSFNFKTDRPVYVQLDLEKKGLNYLLVEPGDSVCVQSEKDTVLFSGKGAVRCQYSYLETKRIVYWLEHRTMQRSDIINDPVAYFQKLDSFLNSQLLWLDKEANNFSQTSYLMLKADLIGSNRYTKLLWINFFQFDSTNKNKKLAKELFADNIFKQDQYAELYDKFAYSLYYPLYLYLQTQLYYYITRDCDSAGYPLKVFYDLASMLYDGVMREKIQMRYMLDQIPKGINNDVEYCINDFYKHSKNREYISLVSGKYNYYKTQLAVGRPAFDFTLPDTAGKKVRLKNYKGKIVILDFWFYGCVGCAQLAKPMTMVKEEFKNNKNVVFMNISVDTKKERWRKGIQDYHLSDCINLYTEGKGEKHQIVTSYNVYGFPILLIIGQDGNFLSTNPPDPTLDNGKGLIDLIRKALK